VPQKTLARLNRPECAQDLHSPRDGQADLRAE